MDGWASAKSTLTRMEAQRPLKKIARSKLVKNAIFALVETNERADGNQKKTSLTL